MGFAWFWGFWGYRVLGLQSYRVIHRVYKAIGFIVGLKVIHVQFYLGGDQGI